MKTLHASSSCVRDDPVIQAGDILLADAEDHQSRQHCRSVEDRAFLCFNCGQGGHRTFGCKAKSRCPVCAQIECHRAG
ncbi:hypothetical protein ALC56_09111 [Trachymyrmex septentrionalis]|uniref:CCHC-type domain-containing protein n=1 Tax=Trachymyrmex septentrionalis TaxID=34720 RepID=A0A151JUU9_9HYME|nr:hypothetical protein ALC56_09111 [Trachymyrmex septentrionalis]